MIKKINIVLVVLILFSLPILGQSEKEKKQPSKILIGINRAIAQSKKDFSLAKKKNGNMTIPSIGVIVKCSDVNSVSNQLKTLNLSAKIITDSVLTVKLPINMLDSLTKMNQVLQINASQRRKPSLYNSRNSMQVNKVHQGEGLETPYTGEGVIVGVIDQGFSYQHPAFKNSDGKSRIVAIYDNSKDNSTPLTDETLISKQISDNFSTYHATHVTSIAAGSKISNHLYAGIAPEADLIMMPCNFDDDEILEDVKFVRDYAAQHGKPWVINMSFGSQFGPHDGSTDYDKSLSKLVKQGGLITAAMGNEGDLKLHYSHTFTSDKDTVYLLLEESVSDPVIDVWANSKYKLEVIPLMYSSRFDKFYNESSSFWNNRGLFEDEVNPNNGKDHSSLNPNLTAIYSSYPSDSYQFALAIVGAANSTFHAWIEADNGEFVTTRSSVSFPEGNSIYCVGEGAASSEKVVAVGAYVTSSSWNSIDGNSYSMNSLRNNDIAYFSSIGPQVDNNRPKPAITAPGAAITAAYSNDFAAFNMDEEEPYIVNKIISNNKNYYYGVDLGTSMSSPMVAGVLALWLQANPELTYDNVIDIFKKTSIKDSYTGNSEWSNKWGYGKIDAYNGLKEALALANQTGINEIKNTQKPLTIYKKNDGWNFLFNNDESYAIISLFTIDGKLLNENKYSNIEKGDDFHLDLSNCQKGIFLIKVKTSNSSYVRKCIKK